MKLTPTTVRPCVRLDNDTVWKPLLEAYHKQEKVVDEWIQQHNFIMDFLDTHHSEKVKYYGGYPSQRIFEEKLKQYRIDNRILSLRSFICLQKKYPITSTIQLCKFNKVTMDDNNNPWIIFRCGHARKLSLLDATKKDGKPLIPVEQKIPDNDCADCLAYHHCKKLQNQANLEVERILHRFEKSHLFDWKHGSPQTINLLQVVSNNVCIPKELKKDSRSQLSRQLKLTVMDIPSVVDGIDDDKELQCLKEKLLGGFYPDSYEMPKSKVVSFAPRSTIGVLKWKVNNVTNYAIVDKADLDDTTIVEFGRMANREKLAGCRFPRSGKAAGIKGPPLDERYDPVRFSEATKNTPRIHFATKTGYGTAYESTNPKDKSRPNVSFVPRQDIEGKKLGRIAKKDLLSKDEAMRRVTICKLKSRLRASAIIDSLKLDDVSGIWADIEESMHEAIKPKTINKWHNIDNSLSLWDIVFLEWAGLSEEAWNFMAVAFHEDGDNRDFETMMIMGLVEDNNLRQQASTIVQGMSRGLTVLPFQGVALESQPGRTIIHMRVDHSLHASDRTRNQGNFAVLTDYERRRLGAAARAAGIVH